jgi:hypothetical protein
MHGAHGCRAKFGASVTDTDRSQLLRLRSDFESILNNIEWNLAAFVSAAAIIINPKLLDLHNLPMRISSEGLDIDGFQAVGLALLEKDRKSRANELLAAAKRSLICESLEICADYLARGARIASGEGDPYVRDDYFSVDIRELWSGKPGRSGILLEEREREFIQKALPHSAISSDTTMGNSLRNAPSSIQASLLSTSSTSR